MVRQGGEDGVGDGADTRLDRRPVRDPLGDEARNPIVDLRARRRSHLDQRPVYLDPPENLADMNLVAPERAWLLGVGLEEEPGAPDERRRVVGVDSQTEVAVSIGTRGSSKDERVTGLLTKQVAHLAEVVGHEVERPGLEARSGHVGQEVRHVPQSVAERPVQVRAVVHGVHLMDPDALQRFGVGLDGVEEADGLAVGKRDDEVGAR